MSTSKRGGARPGAGRKSPLGPTTVIRLPIVLKAAVDELIRNSRNALPEHPDAIAFDQDAPPLKLPLFGDSVPAGFPSPATDYTDTVLDLNELLINHPSSTFFVRAKGHSMIGAGIFDNDLLVVDRSISATHGSIVIAWVDTEFTVKRLYQQNDTIKLVAENPDYPDIVFKDGQEMRIWGVVTNAIHQFS